MNEDDLIMCVPRNTTREEIEKAKKAIEGEGKDKGKNKK
jgi:hypothetical protein